jgi:hypothetical protein
MKKTLILCGLLLLTACIDVDDYGDYWSKTMIDPSLQGRWAKVSEENETKLTGQEWTFTLKDDAYSVQSFKDGKKADEDPLYPVKSMQIGNYTFLASGPERGTIVRYNIVGDTATIYVANPSLAWDFIAKQFPDQLGIYRDDPDPADSAEDNRDRPLRVKEFDDDVAKVLAAIPNNGTYWEIDTELKKVQ